MSNDYPLAFVQDAYTVTAAAYFAQTTPTTVRNWLQGYDYVGHHMEPVLGGVESGLTTSRPRRISFLKLSELILAVKFRHGTEGEGPITLDRIRLAHRFAREHLCLDYPFASGKFFVHGGEILGEFEVGNPGRGHLAYSLGGQWVLPGLVWAEIEHFAFNDTSVLSWYPYGTNKPIVLNPRVRGGSRSSRELA